MGQLTRASIVTEGLLKAGKDPTSFATRANTRFNARLRSLYKGAPWSFLQKQRSGLALATGATSVSVGAGSGGVTPEIKLIRSPILIHASNYNTRVIANIVQLTGTFDDIGFDNVVRRGVPNSFKVRAGTLWGNWSLVPMLVPDRDLLLTFDYQEQPADIIVAAGGDSSVPIYPNDLTLIQAVVLDAVIDMYGVDSSEASAATDEFSALAARDRMEYASVPGTNDELGLDSSVFKRW